VTAAILRQALEAMTDLIHPRGLLPPLDIEKTADALAAAEKLRQRIPSEI
jgi:hypothetical protein